MADALNRDFPALSDSAGAGIFADVQREMRVESDDDGFPYYPDPEAPFAPVPAMSGPTAHAISAQLIDQLHNSLWRGGAAALSRRLRIRNEHR
jgi:hypothetical protein